MNHAFWVGVYPGLGDEAIDYVVSVLEDLVGEAAGRHVPAPHFSGAKAALPASAGEGEETIGCH